MEEDLEFSREKPLNRIATPALPGCLQWRGRCMGACFFFNWKATSFLMKLLMDVVEKNNPQVFFSLKIWGFFGNGHLIQVVDFFFKKLGAWILQSVPLRSLVKVNVFLGQSVESLGAKFVAASLCKYSTLGTFVGRYSQDWLDGGNSNIF